MAVWTWRYGRYGSLLVRRRTLGGQGRDGRDRLRRLFAALRERLLQGHGQNLIHGFDKTQLHGIAQILRNLGQVFLIVLRQDHLEQSGAMRGQKFFFQSADRQHFAAQRNLAGHGDIATHRNLAQSAGNRGRDRDSGGGTILGDGAFRHVHVNVEGAVEITLQPQAMRPRTHIRHSRLRRFLHYVAEFAGQREFAFAIYDGSFGAQDGATDFGPRQAGHQPDFTLLVGQRVAELDHTQEIVDVVLSDGDVVAFAVFYHFASDLAAHVADFTLQVANAGFPRVRADQG